MHRTQIYITQKEQGSLTKLSKETGKTKSELIREAIDKLIAEYVSVDWKQIFLSETFSRNNMSVFFSLVAERRNTSVMTRILFVSPVGSSSTTSQSHPYATG